MATKAQLPVVIFKGDSLEFRNERLLKIFNGESFEIRNEPPLPIPSFNGESYELWSIQMKTFFMSEGLWEFVESGCTATEHQKRDPYAKENQKFYAKENKKRDADALFIIQMAVEESILSKIAAATTSQQAWSILKTEYQGSTKPATEKENKTKAEQEQVVNPWEVSAKGTGKIDYDKLIHQFGCQRLDKTLVDRVFRLTSRSPHIFLRRNVFFAHRDFNEILDAYERGEKFYLYTGRGPSSEALHLGHLVPFLFTKYLQEAFKVPLVIQLTDDEKYMWKKLSIQESKRLARENAKDIIACGFDVSRTFIFSDFNYVGGAFYENMLKVASRVPYNKAVSTFGFTGEDHVGKTFFPAVQAVPSFPSSFPHLFSGNDKLRCLIPCAIDQDPYFRITRDVAPRLGYHKPALIESFFLPALQGETGKMSASDANSAIYLTDSRKDIEYKVKKYAFSGGQDSLENHRKYGANLEVDIAFKYLSFFLEDDDELEHIRKEYGSGRMLTGEVQKRLIDVLTEIVEKHCANRAAVTDEMVDAFMAVRPLPNKFN